MQWKYNLKDFPVDRVDYSVISDCEYYLKAEACAHNTAMKYLGDFKKNILLCVKRGWLPKDPFLGYKMSRRHVQKDYLTEQELTAIATKVCLTDRLALVRDIVVFSCYTGLAYADVKKLKRSEIRIGIDDKKALYSAAKIHHPVSGPLACGCPFHRRKIQRSSAVSPYRLTNTT